MNQLNGETNGPGGERPAYRSVSDHDRSLQFGAYRVIPGARTVLCDGEVVPIGSRAFDLLVVLLRSRGALVTKDEIVREVWPSVFVDESNLRFQVGMLRKALGMERNRIKTIPGRGYLFVSDDEEALAAPTSLPADVAANAREDQSQSIILIVEPNTAERNAMTSLLRALKVSVLSFRSVDEVAAFAISPLRHAAN